MVLWRVMSLGIIDPGGVTPALDHWSECIPPLNKAGKCVRGGQASDVLQSRTGESEVRS